jgi:hypothetical protein
MQFLVMLFGCRTFHLVHVFNMQVECDEGEVHLLELDESHQSERTVFIMPPEPNGLPPGRMYSYKVIRLQALVMVCPCRWMPHCIYIPMNWCPLTQSLCFVTDSV